MTHTEVPPVTDDPSTPAAVPAAGTPVSLRKPSTPARVPAKTSRGSRATGRPGTRRPTRAALRRVLAHERTRVPLRHGMYLLGGTRIVARRAWDGRTTARHERMMRTAEAAGNTDLAADWEARASMFRAARHQRRMDLLKAPQRAVKSAAVGVAATEAGLLALGGVLAYSTGDVADVLAPTSAVLDFIAWVYLLAGLVWGPLVTIGPWVALLVLWDIGRRQQAVPQWALPARQRDTEGAPITPSIVVTALRDLGVSTLRKAVKEMGDGGAAMLSPIALAGCGVELDATLPSGVSTEEVMNRRRKLAENLGRHEHEVHLSVAPAPRTVRMWIADSGALDEPVPASPLVLDETMTANYRTGRAPWGLDLRGDQAALSVYQRHLLITGLSNQGKTAALRALALWLALDPTVEFRIGDLKGVGDWRMFNGLATVLIEGPTDDHVIDVTEMVEGGFAEMQDRLQAPPGTAFPPLVLIVDEAQVAYGCGAIGLDKRPYGGSKATSRYFQAVKKIHDQGRAVNVTIWEGTQDPTNENLPKRSREGNHIRAALALGTESQARMAVGDAAVDAGAAPHKLRQGLDKGQVVVAGDGLQLAAGQVAVNVRTHFVDGDQAAEIADRAKALRTAVDTRQDDAGEDVDHLADVAAVLGSTPRMRTQEVLQRLAEANPRRYRDWTFPSLTAVLEGTGAEPYKSNGQMVVGRDRVRDAIAGRDS